MLLKWRLDMELDFEWGEKFQGKRWKQRVLLKTEERFQTWNYVKILKRNENSTKLQFL